MRAAAQPAVDKIEVAAKDGELETVLGLPVLGWHIKQVCKLGVGRGVAGVGGVGMYVGGVTRTGM